MLIHTPHECKKNERSVPYTSKQMVTKYVAYQNPIKNWDNFKHEHKKIDWIVFKVSL